MLLVLGFLNVFCDLLLKIRVSVHVFYLCLPKTEEGQFVTQNVASY